MPADIKLLSTMSVQTLSNMTTETPPKRAVLVQHRTHSKRSPATPTQPHKANHTVPVPANPLHPLTSFRKQQQKSCSPDTAPGLEVVSLPAEAAKASAPDQPREAVPAAISQHLLHCFSAERKWLLSPGTHGSLSRRVLYSAQFSSKVSACGGELPVLGTGGFWLQWLLTLPIASGVC